MSNICHNTSRNSISRVSSLHRHLAGIRLQEQYDDSLRRAGQHQTSLSLIQPSGATPQSVLRYSAQNSESSILALLRRGRRGEETPEHPDIDYSFIILVAVSEKK